MVVVTIVGWRCDGDSNDIKDSLPPWTSLSFSLQGWSKATFVYTTYNRTPRVWVGASITGTIVWWVSLYFKWDIGGRTRGMWGIRGNPLSLHLYHWFFFLVSLSRELSKVFGNNQTFLIRLRLVNPAPIFPSVKFLFLLKWLKGRMKVGLFWFETKVLKETKCDHP